MAARTRYAAYLTEDYRDHDAGTLWCDTPVFEEFKRQCKGVPVRCVKTTTTITVRHEEFDLDEEEH